MKNSPRKDFPSGRIFPGLQVMYDREPTSAAMNMAIDEALLQTTIHPVLRFYGWRRPSLSLGYFGRFADVAGDEPDREIIRRWTGGGIVRHGSDLTYSVILPHRHMPDLPSARVTYRDIHGAIQEVLAEQTEATLADADAPKVSETCFANPVTADVLVRGRKIAGAAQRRTRAGLLHQGSIQYDGLPGSFPDAFARTLCVDFATIASNPELIQRAQKLTDEKYGTSEWLRQR